jgi:adenylyltransferase/sulfurtransferase
VVPGLVGLVQATEASKLILGIGTPMIGKFFVYNALSLTTELIETGKNPDCALCGENPRITGLTGKVREEYDSGRQCG